MSNLTSEVPWMPAVQKKHECIQLRPSSKKMKWIEKGGGEVWDNIEKKKNGKWEEEN